MKLKLYLRMVVAVMVAMLTATGCNSSKEEPVGPVNDPLTFQLEVSDIGTGKATVAVKPNKDTPTYYCGAMEKSVYDAFASEADFLAADLKRLQNLATQNKMTLKAYLETNTYRGEGNRTVMTSAAKTAHYAYVYGIKADGMVTSTVYKVEFISGDVPAGPVVDLKMWPGTDDGANKSVMLSFSVAVTKSPAVSSKYYFAATSEIEKALAAGETYETLAASSEYAFTAEMITEMNSPAGLTGYGFGSVAKPLPANTSHTLIVLATDANGVVSVEHVEAATEKSGGNGPALDLEFFAGDGTGAFTDTKMTFFMKSSGATSGKFGIFLKADVDALIAQGISYDEIVSYEDEEGANGIDFSDDPTWLPKLNSADGLGLTMPGLDPNTAYTLIVKVNDATGSTVKFTSASTTGGGGGEGPTLTVQMLPGDNKDANKDTYMRLGVVSSSKDVTSCKYYLNTTAEVDALIKGGKSYDEVITANGVDVPVTGGYIEAINGTGLAITYKELMPGTSYTGIIKAGNGKAYTVKYMAASTEGGGEATTKELKNLAKGSLEFWGDSYNIPENDYANWTVYLADATVNLEDLSGKGDVMMLELNTAKSAKTEITPGTYNVMPNRAKASFVAFSCVPGYVQGTTPFGTWYISEKSAINPISSGTVVVAKSGNNYTFTLNLLDQSTNTTIKGSYTGVMSYTDKTQKSAPALAPRKVSGNYVKAIQSMSHTLRVEQIAVPCIPSFSLVLKSTPDAFNRLQTKLQMTKLSSAAYNAKPKSATYEMVRVK